MKETILFNQKFISATTTEILEFVENELIDSNKAKIISAINVYLITLCYQKKEISDFYNHCDIVTVDGRPLVYISKLFSKYSFPEMVGGPNLWTNLLDSGSKKNRTFYFIGSTEETLIRAILNIKKLFDNINIVGSHHGYFEINGIICSEVVDEIKRLKPDFIFIGTSSPKKEYFAEILKTNIDSGIIVLIGGAFDLFAGEKKIGNELTSKLCLDWLLRLLQEPQRLGWRYLRSNTIFILMLINELFKRIKYFLIK